MPVIEALERQGSDVAKILISDRAGGDRVDRIQDLAQTHNVPVHRVARPEVTRLSRNQKQDQGVVADVRAPHMDDLSSALEAGEVTGPLLALVGITTPGNVGMILRAATAAGLGIVLPRQGCPEVGPLVVKASAGVAFGARILRCPTSGEGLDALRTFGFRILGLAATGGQTLWKAALGRTDVLVLGSETRGLSRETAARLDGHLQIPMVDGVESLNVATAAAVVSFELRRRGLC